MARPVSAFSDFVLSVTNQTYIKKVVDNILNGNFGLMRFLSNSRPWNGGDQVLQPIKIQKGTSNGSYAGLDTLSTAQTSDRIMAAIEPRQYYASVVVSGIQQAVNQGDGRVLDLLATEMESKASDLKDTMGDGFYGDGTGNANKDIVGLRAAVDDSTFVTTYEGISRATYTQWRSTITSDATVTLPDFATDFNAAKVGAEDPTLILSTPAIFNIYEALMDQDVRYSLQFTGYDQIYGKGLPRKSSNLAQGQGFNSLYFRGIPFVADEKCTAGRLYTLNENHIWFTTFRKHPKHSAEKHGFFWTGLKEPVNQDGDVGQLLWYGNLASDGPRFSALRYSITG